MRPLYLSASILLFIACGCGVATSPTLSQSSRAPDAGDSSVDESRDHGRLDGGIVDLDASSGELDAGDGSSDAGPLDGSAVDSGPPECREHADCADAEKPECSDDGECVACTEDAACSDRGAASLCHTGRGALRGHCVECREHQDCEDLAEPQCSSAGSCMSCTNNDACEGRASAEQCNQRAGAPTFGTCVECTGATEGQMCGASSCMQSSGQCTDTPRASLEVCEACEADSECKAGTKCVRHMLGAHDLGTVCVYQDTIAGCASSANAGMKPFSQTVHAMSVDSTINADYCFPRTSCKAYEDAVVGVSCGTDATLCGEPDIEDGYCPTTGPRQGQCSYGCTEDYDCPGALISECSGDVIKFCRP